MEDTEDTEGTEGTADSAPDGRDRAILAPGQATAIDVSRHNTDRSLRHFVDYLWIVRWQADEPHTQRVIPQPIVHVAAENGRLSAHGVGDNEFVRTLRGQGHVLGIAFRPGGFHALLGQPVSTVTRSVIPIGDLIDIDDRPVAAELARPADDETLVRIADEWLAGLRLQRDPVIDEIAALVDRAEHDTTITRAEQLASLAGMSLRTLQRLFGEYVGIGPKWVIQRFRLLDVAAVANAGGEVEWAGAAIDLGFSDQAHMIRAFTRIVGTPPATYARRQSGAGASAAKSAEDDQQDQ